MEHVVADVALESGALNVLVVANETVLGEPLLNAIRYYEIADRFKESDSGRKAMDLSLKFMQQVGERTKLAEYKPAATDGKGLGAT